MTRAEFADGPSPPFPEFVRRWHHRIYNSYSSQSNGTFKGTIERSVNRHFTPQIELCDLSYPFALSKYNYVLRFTSRPQIVNDTLKMLEDLGLSSFYYRMGKDRKEPMFEESIKEHPSNASSKIRDFYDKKTALLAYDIFQRDYEILGYEFPFPEWL